MERPFRDSFVPVYEENLSSEKNTEENTILKPLKLPKPPKRQFPFKTLVLCAGSTKAFAHIGALVALEEMGYLNSIKRLVGVSSGGCILAYYSVGYTPREMFEDLLKLDFASGQKIECKNLFLNLGFDKGDKFCEIVQNIIAKKCSPHITLSEIYKMTGKSLHLGVTKVNNTSYEFLNRHTHPDLPVWLALRMTTSIPILYAPVKYLGNTYVDGGCIDGFPISYFDSKTTLAFSFELKNDNEKKTAEDVLLDMMNMFRSDKSVASKLDSKVMQIYIPIPRIPVLDFTISTERKQMLHDAGYTTVMERLTHTL
jgi:predicted acylesterase/phospholipase RssA